MLDKVGRGNIVPHPLFGLPIFQVLEVEIIVEDHSTLIDPKRLDNVDVHHVAITIDEQVGIQIAIGNFIAQPLVFTLGFGSLDGGSLINLNLEATKIEALGQLFVSIETMVAAIEAVIHKHLPVAIHLIDFAGEELEFCPLGLVQNVVKVGHIIFECSGIATATKWPVQIKEDHRPPGINTDGG